jgi:hypothetical protein
MTLLQDRLTRVAEQGSTAVIGAIRTWAAGMQQLGGALADPTAVVEGAFDTGEQLLRAQREVALTVLRLARGDRR